MIASTEHKEYRRLMKKGKGSILKAIRIEKGAGAGLIAGGIVFLIFALLFCMFGGLLFFGIPALILFVIGGILKHKRDQSWLSYYMEQTGYSEGELAKIDRELAAPSTAVLIAVGPAGNKYISCFFTERYMVLNNVEPYVRRLDDFIAAAFSDSTDIWYLCSLTKRDRETKMIGLYTDTSKKKALCSEIIEELRRRNPNILCGQLIACEGRRYILERDGAQILRLYQEGRRLEAVQ